MTTLLVELFTEELPPKALKRLGESFADVIRAELARAGLLEDNAVATAWASPRRLAVSIDHVRATAPDRDVTEKIMPVAVALTADGQPSPALRKKLEARGIALDAVAQFERRPDGKHETFFYTYTAAGARLADELPRAVQESVRKLPIPKVMHWGDSDVTFVRPVHKLVALYGSEIIDCEVLGLFSDRITGGHRFLSEGDITLPDAESYARVLEQEGRVVAGFDDRRERIRAGLDARAAMLGWPALHQELARIDPQTAARLAPHDSQRLQRALEVWQLTGQPLSSFHADEKTTALPFNVLRLALDTGERAWIHERIARRFRLMLDAGFVDEMRTLLHDYPELHPDLPSMRCVGYRQAWEWLRGECSEDEFIERGIASGAPASESWRAALGLVVTMVWLYTELLRILSYFRD